MEVAGKDSDDKSLCFVCSDHGISTLAELFCNQCGDYMCFMCFENHKKWRLAKNHTFVDKFVMEKDKDGDIDKSSAHAIQNTKFYCPTHDQVGCSDCMILEHKACAVEYVREKAELFKDSQDFNCFVKGIEECQERAKELESSINDIKEDIAIVKDMFVKDVQNFKDEIILCVGKLADDIKQEADKIKIQNIQLMNDLEFEREKLSTDITTMHTAEDLLIDQPNKLFVSMIQHKPTLTCIESQLEDIESRNKIEIYDFERDENIECVLEKSAELGSLQRRLVSSISTVGREVVSQKDTEKKPHSEGALKSQLQPLIQKPLTCRNIAIDVDCLSYTGNGCDVGLYLYNTDHIPSWEKIYFEVEIMNMGERGAIVIGAVPKYYPENLQPGWGKYSIGYHAMEGKVYQESRTGRTFGPACIVGDRIGCCLRRRLLETNIVYARNGEKTGEVCVASPYSLYLAIGLQLCFEKVKVIQNPNISCF